MLLLPLFDNWYLNVAACCYMIVVIVVVHIKEYRGDFEKEAEARLRDHGHYAS